MCHGAVWTSDTQKASEESIAANNEKERKGVTVFFLFFPLFSTDRCEGRMYHYDTRFEFACAFRRRALFSFSSTRVYISPPYLGSNVMVLEQARQRIGASAPCPRRSRCVPSRILDPFPYADGHCHAKAEKDSYPRQGNSTALISGMPEACGVSSCASPFSPRIEQ